MSQGTWAINDVVFSENCDQNSGTGGRDGRYEGSIASSTVKLTNQDSWEINAKVYGAYQCVRLGDGSNNNGILTTPSITPGTTYALLTFSAAGWGDAKENKLTITATNSVDISGDTQITLENEEWLDYSVLINTNGASNFKITFTGRRIFLDDVIVRRVDLVEAPTLPASDSFWPNTTEAATKSITLSPASFTSIRYTTNGTTPTTSTGNLVTASSTIVLNATTTIKAIAYIGTLASEVTTKTYTLGTTFVNSIAEFNSLAENTEAQLYLSTDKNARVLHGADGKMYLRDNTGTLCVDLGSAAAFNPAPAHNQHIAGWIIGKKQSVNGLSKLANTTNTNTNHLALAAPVTEAATAPVLNIATDDINNYVGNWVTIKDVRNDGSSTTVSGIYNNALVDVSGIVTANNAILPVNYANIKPVVYVIDEEKDFASPNTNITGATVRLKRTLKAGQWNTFCVPMNLAISADMAGKYRQYSGVDNNTMTFSEANSIEAGKPYLVKPDADIVNKTFENVTLSATSAAEITQGTSTLAFIGTYSPKELKTDKTEQFLTASGQLAYPKTSANATIKGMRAYFYVPDGVTARIFIDGETTGVNEVRGKMADGRSDIYNLNGQKVLNPTKGLYIVNGKKMVIK